MKPTASTFNRALFALAPLLLASCSSTPRSGSASVQGAPRPLANPQVIASVIAADEAASSRHKSEQTQMPDQLTVPGVYRPVMIDGKQVLVRETDPKRLNLPGSLRISGDSERGNIAIQPALLERELATEVVKLKQAQANSDANSQRLIEQSNTLAQQTRALQQANANLTVKLVEMTKFAKELEARLAESKAADKK